MDNSESNSADNRATTSRGAIVKSLLVYLVLVVPPVVGLIGILHAGERIVPPRHVGGGWELSEEAALGLAAPCLALGRSGVPIELHVTQSGPQVEIHLGREPGRSLRARLGGDSLTGTWRLPDDAGCPGVVELHARVAGDRMRGTVRHPDCAPCPSTPFDAVRQRRHAER